VLVQLLVLVNASTARENFVVESVNGQSSCPKVKTEKEACHSLPRRAKVPHGLLLIQTLIHFPPYQRTLAARPTAPLSLPCLSRCKTPFLSRRIPRSLFVANRRRLTTQLRLPALRHEGAWHGRSAILGCGAV
jgi:hypothetical protein